MCSRIIYTSITSPLQGNPVGPDSLCLRGRSRHSRAILVVLDFTLKRFTPSVFEKDSKGDVARAGDSLPPPSAWMTMNSISLGPCTALNTCEKRRIYRSAQERESSRRRAPRDQDRHGSFPVNERLTSACKARTRPLRTSLDDLCYALLLVSYTSVLHGRAGLMVRCRLLPCVRPSGYRG